MKRNKEIDIARGIGTLLVTLGHSMYINKYFKEWIYSFHMPLFFFISGYLFNYDKYKDNYKLFLKKKIKSFIIPYILLALFIWFILFLFDYKFILTEEAKNRFIGIFIGFRLSKYYFCLWFVLVLFFIENIFYFLIKYLKRYLYCIAIFMFTISYFEFKYINGFIYSIDLIPISLFFFITGYLFKRDFYKFSCKINKYLKLCLSFIFLVIGYCFAHLNSVYHGLINIYDCNIGNPIYYFVAAFSGIFCVYLFSYGIRKCNILEDLGKNTLIIYAFQNPIVFPIAYYFIDCLSLHSKNINFLISIILALPLLRLIAYLIDKYIPVMSGKSK